MESFLTKTSTSQERQNSHFRHSNITQCSISSLNYQNGHISLSSLFLGSFSSLNYKNGHFSPKNLLLGSLSSLNYRSGYFSPRTFLFGSSSLLISMFFHNSTTVNYMPCFAREARYTWVTQLGLITTCGAHNQLMLHMDANYIKSSMSACQRWMIDRLRRWIVMVYA